MARNSKTLLLKENLLKDLKNGLLHPGEMIPSEHSLSFTYDLTRPTVRSVLAELCAMGLLEKRPGVGTFVRNPTLPTAKKKRSLCIGSDIFFSTTEYFSRPIASGIMESPFAENSNFIHISSRSSAAEMMKADAFLLDNSFKNDKLDFLTSLKKPVIQLSVNAPYPEVSFITVDNRAEACRGVDLLIRYGYRKIAIIGENSISDTSSTFLRSRGYEQALTDAGLPIPDSRNCFPITGIGHPSRDFFMEWLKESDFDAVFFVNGVAFLNTYPFMIEYFGKAFYDLKLLIFDDISKMPLFQDLSAFFIRQPLREFGLNALEYLHRKVDDPAIPLMRKYLRCTIVMK